MINAVSVAMVCMVPLIMLARTAGPSCLGYIYSRGMCTKFQVKHAVSLTTTASKPGWCDTKHEIAIMFRKKK